MKKFLTGAVCRFILAGLLIFVALLSLGIWIPQLSGILEMNKMTSWWVTMTNAFSLDITFGIGYIAMPIITALGILLTLSFIPAIIKILMAKDFSSSKRLFADKFVSIVIIFVLVCIQKAKFDQVFYYTIFNYDATLTMSILIPLCLIGYIVVFFVLNKIQTSVEKSVNKKETSKESKAKENKTTTQEFESIAKLKELLDSGAINQSEFDAQKAKLLK